MVFLRPEVSRRLNRAAAARVRRQRLLRRADPRRRCRRISPGTSRRTRAASRFACTLADPSRDGVGQFKGGINELHQRFREQEVALFVKHGAEILGVWQHLDDPNTLVWMLAYRDRAHREEVWAAFGKDPEWDALRKKYFVPLKTNTFLMSASDYSPMK